MARTYPRTPNLSYLKRYLPLLSNYALPLIELSSSKMKRLLNDRVLAQNIYNEINEWKNRYNINTSDDLEYKYLMENVYIISSRKINRTVDPFIPLSYDGPIIEELYKSNKIKMYFLSELGFNLNKLLFDGEDVEYDSYLFWLIIRSKKLIPLMQNLFCDMDSYVNKIKPNKYTNDEMSISTLKSWGNYFNFLSDDRMNVSTTGYLMLYSIIYEINELITRSNVRKFFIDELEEKLGFIFRINTSFFDFTHALEIICNQDPDVNGFTSGRRRLGLPNNPDTHIIEFKSKVEVSNFERVNKNDVIKIIGGGLSSE